MKKTKLTIYSDSGHSWLKVPKKIIKRLNLQDKITHYSYMDTNNVYLEEDYDMSLFFKAMFPDKSFVVWKDIESIFEIEEKYKETSHIRNKKFYENNA